MTPEQQAILAFLQENASGSANAITADEIFRRLTDQGHSLFAGRTQEQVRGYIRKLVKNQSFLIGGGENGYYVIATKEDILKAMQNLGSRSKSIDQRKQVLRNEWNSQNPDNQI